MIRNGDPHIHVNVISPYPGFPREYWSAEVDESLVVAKDYIKKLLLWFEKIVNPLCDTIRNPVFLVKLGRSIKKKTMVYKKELAERIEDLLQKADIKNFEVKRVFGGVGYLVNGNMACGMNNNNLIIRVGKNAYHSSLQISDVREFDLIRRPMTSWANVSSANLKSETDLFAWIMKGVQYARSLPAK